MTWRVIYQLPVSKACYVTDGHNIILVSRDGTGGRTPNAGWTLGNVGDWFLSESMAWLAENPEPIYIEV